MSPFLPVQASPFILPLDLPTPLPPSPLIPFPSLLPPAIKYSTAFPVIILSAVKYHVELEAWRGFYRPLWIAAAILNTCYSYYWDIARDWDFG